MWFFKKTSPRRNHVRKKKIAEEFSQTNLLTSTDHLISALLLLLFVVVYVLIISFGFILRGRYLDLIPRTVIALLISLGAAFYIYHYQKRIVQNYARAIALAGLFTLLLAITKLGVLLSNQTPWATASAVTAAVILTISYDQRFAIGMSVFYCLFAYFAASPLSNINLFLMMAVGSFTCCFSLREVRTRMKLLEVGTFAGAIVFITAVSLDLFSENPHLGNIFSNAGRHAGATLMVGVLIQGLLPLIEKIFRIATSMTLLDYSDANQPLVKQTCIE